MTLRYVGRSPDADGSVVNKGYVDSRYDLIKVDADYIEDEVATYGLQLTTKSYVDAQDALRAKKSIVDAADAAYIPVTQRGVANGVASIGSDGYIPSGQLPTLQTSRQPIFKNADTVFISGQINLTTVDVKGYRAATLTVADPGYPYHLLSFASVMGGSVNGTSPRPDKGTGNYGQLTVLRQDDVVYGKAITNGNKVVEMTHVLPYGTASTNPSNYPPRTGATVLDLYLGLYGGTTYSFFPTAFQFFCLVYPAV